MLFMLRLFWNFGVCVAHRCFSFLLQVNDDIDFAYEVLASFIHAFCMCRCCTLPSRPLSKFMSLHHAISSGDSDRGVRATALQLMLCLVRCCGKRIAPHLKVRSFSRSHPQLIFACSICAFRCGWPAVMLRLK
jgi:hypothetical protein